MSTWRIVRGVKTNRVRRKFKRDMSPQRAKARHQRGETSAEDWTVISISLRVADLVAIDDLVNASGLSRSRFLVEKAKGKL